LIQKDVTGITLYLLFTKFQSSDLSIQVQGHQKGMWKYNAQQKKAG
jgi:hypothetical protein